MASTSAIALEATHSAPAPDRGIADVGVASEAALDLARSAGLSITAADILHRRGFRAGGELDAWLDPKLAALTPPSAMVDLGAACERLAAALRKGERIAVFGDYDCDGITACAIMTEALRALGGSVEPLLASRFAGGYGLSQAALDRVRATAPSLLVTCDCGSSDHERLAELKQRGIDAIVIDHHLVPAEPLPALAFLNPHRPECGFPYKGLASCGLALFVAAALRRALGAELDVRRFLDLVAVGTIADVAPLDGDNRILVRAGLKRLAGAERPGLRALSLNGSGGRVRRLDGAPGKGSQPVSAEDVAYQIAPRLNAPGRLGDPAAALEVLLEKNGERAWELAAGIETTTVKRREIQRGMIDEALAAIRDAGFEREPALVLASADWHPGVVGIVAGRLADVFSKPTVVIALEGGSGRGSARAPAGFRLYDALAASRDTLIGFGGHQAAAGLEVALDRVEAFRAAFASACATQLEATPLRSRRRDADAHLDLRDDLRQVADDLTKIEPCGEGNPSPRLLVRDVTVSAARSIRDHLKAELVVAGRALGAFGPDLGKESERILGARIDVVGRLKRDHFRGGDALEIVIERLGPSAR